MIYPADWADVTCHDWCENENKIWLCLANKNAVCEIDKSDRTIKILGHFPHNRLGERDLSLSVGKCGSYIVFCPFQANDIAILNVCTETLEFIDIRELLEKRNFVQNGVEKFYRMFFESDCVYFFGIKYPAIMRLDLVTKEVELFDGWLGEIEKHMCKEAVLFTDGYARKNDDIYLPIGRCNGVLKLNWKTMAWQYMEIPSISHGILGMTQKENVVWLTEYDIGAKKFFQWNLDSGRVISIELPVQDCFYAPLYCEHFLLFTPNFGRKGYLYELESGNWRDVTDWLPELKYSSDKKVRDREVIYFSNRGRGICRWNFETGEIRCDEIKIREQAFLTDSWISHCGHYRQKLKKHIVQESKLSLREYLKVLCADL